MFVRMGANVIFNYVVLLLPRSTMIANATGMFCATRLLAASVKGAVVRNISTRFCGELSAVFLSFLSPIITLHRISKNARSTNSNDA